MTQIDPYGDCGWGQPANNVINFTDKNRLYLEMFNNIALQHLSNKKLRILEVGPGWGKFAEILLENPNLEIEKYTIMDAAGSITKPKMHLSKFSDKVDFYLAEDYEQLRCRHFDVLISIQCLSETPHEYSSFILENFNYSNIFIIDEGNKKARFGEYFCNFWMSNISKKTIQNFVITNMYGKDTQVAWFGRKNKTARKCSYVQGLKASDILGIPGE